MPQKPHVTLKQVRGELAERGFMVSHGALWNFVKRLGLSFKKTVHAEEVTRPDVTTKRKWWFRLQTWLNAARLVFIDEIWSRPIWPLAQLVAKGPKASRSTPYGHYLTLIFLASLRVDGITAPHVFDGQINGESFLLYVEQFLVPTLRRGDIVIMDKR